MQTARELDDRLRLLSEHEAVATAQVVAAAEAVGVHRRATENAMASGDLGLARAARDDGEGAKLVLAGHEAWLTEVRTQATAARVDRARLDQLAALAAEIDEAADALDAAIAQCNADVLTARSSLLTVQTIERHGDQLRLRYASARAAVEGSNFVERAAAPRPHVRLEISQDLLFQLQRG